MTVKSLEVGAFGWQHAGWIDTYYPEDLPEDWRLDFYSHHFNVILMPETEWLHVSEDEIRQWLEDVKEGFQFFFAINDADITKTALKQIGIINQILRQYFAGIVIKSKVGNLNDDVQNLKNLGPVFIDGIELSGSEYSACWRKGSQIENATIGFISEQEAENLREVRACIEAFLAQSGDVKVGYLIFEGSPLSTKTMQDTQVIIQMLT